MSHFVQHLHRLFASPRRQGTAALAAILAATTPALIVLPAQAQDTVAANGQHGPVRYRVANLGTSFITRNPTINSSGQVAFSLFDGTTPTAWTFDGKRLVNLNTGGLPAYTSGINESGHIAGWFVRDDNGFGLNRAFHWTAAGGVSDLGALGDAWSIANAISNRDEVAGFYGGRSYARPFRWSARNGAEDLGVLGLADTVALAMNDHGLIAGVSQTAEGTTRTFVWTRARGIEDIGTLGGADSSPTAVGAQGEVAGESVTAGPDSHRHVYRWTRAGGMRDLGALGGDTSNMTAMSPNGRIIGTFSRNGLLHAMTWTSAHGMVDLGTLGGSFSLPGGVNDLGQVVGGAVDKSETARAFAWTHAQGMIDLNTRLVNAPAGLFLEKAEAVSNNGAIVVSSNAGLVLLRPLNQEILPEPVVGPIQLPELARTCCATTMKLAFTDANRGEYHRVTVDWGDASMNTAYVSEKGGEGSASAHHIYHTPGLYTVVVRVTDSAGNASSQRRDLIVVGPGQLAAGSGRFLAPLGVNRQTPRQPSMAAFRFLAPGTQAPGGMLSVVTDGLLFRAGSMSAVTGLQGAAGVRRLSGTGQLNGKEGYRYTITASAAAAGTQGRVGLRIWHSDPVSKAEVLDFDNEQVGATRGSAVTEGAVVVTP